jgi:hypothetical protein
LCTFTKSHSEKLSRLERREGNVQRLANKIRQYLSYYCRIRKLPRVHREMISLFFLSRKDSTLWAWRFHVQKIFWSVSGVRTTQSVTIMRKKSGFYHQPCWRHLGPSWRDLSKSKLFRGMVRVEPTFRRLSYPVPDFAFVISTAF